MNDKGIYTVGILLCITLFMVFNYYVSDDPDIFNTMIQPMPGTDQVGDIGDNIVMGEPITPMPETTEVETTPDRVYLGNYRLTAYCPCAICTDKWGERVAANPIQGQTIAVDPTVIPLGSSVFIEGYGTYVAEDTGGAIKNNRIDVFFDSHTEALNFGVKYADVYLED